MKKRYAILGTTFLIVTIFATIAVWTQAQDKGERIYQLRIYTLADEASFENYKEVWRKHMDSLPKHQITVHGVWVPQGTETPYQIWVLNSFPDAESVDRLGKQFMSSEEFKADVAGLPFEMVQVKGGPAITLLKPLDFSPLNVY